MILYLVLEQNCVEDSFLVILYLVLEQNCDEDSFLVILYLVLEQNCDEDSFLVKQVLVLCLLSCILLYTCSTVLIYVIDGTVVIIFPESYFYTEKNKKKRKPRYTV